MREKWMTPNQEVDLLLESPVPFGEADRDKTSVMVEAVRIPVIRYHVTDEAILKYMQWSISTRLTWLEEANRILYAALSFEGGKKKKVVEIAYQRLN
jgi:hypothetical protein